MNLKYDILYMPQKNYCFLTKLLRLTTLEFFSSLPRILCIRKRNLIMTKEALPAPLFLLLWREPEDFHMPKETGFPTAT